jgi:lysophospholipase L1-like esterase
MVAVIALFGVVVVLYFKAYDRTPPPETQPMGNAQTADEPFFRTSPALLVVSDSLAGAYGDPINGRNYPQFLAEKMGWDLNVDAVGARGFLESQVKQSCCAPIIVPPVIDRLDDDRALFRADYIVVDVGRNDLGKNPEAVAPAIDEYYTKLREAYPGAKIIALVPTYIYPKAADNYRFLAEYVSAAATKVRAYILDPVAEGWYRDVDLAPLLWTDRVHPNTAGSEYIAERIADGIRRLGVA